MAWTCKFSAATPETREANGSVNIYANSDLFTGKNANDQNVFSWVATEPITEFDSDISPLFNNILDLEGVKGLNVDIPTFTTFLGYVGFGTQAFNSIGNVTFWVPRLSMDVRPFGE
jgi:hypothetical protein